MKEKYKICCIVGDKPNDFPWKYTDGRYLPYYDWVIEKEIIKLIDMGYNYFICGGTLGVDMDFAQKVLFLRDLKYPEIQLEVAVAYRGQNKFFNKKYKNRYQEIIELADKVILFSEQYAKNVYHKRNEYMVDKAERTVVFWNKKEKGGVYATYQYAQRKAKKIDLVLLESLKTWINTENILMDKLENEDIELPKSDHDLSVVLAQIEQFEKRRKAKRVRRKI